MGLEACLSEETRDTYSVSIEYLQTWLRLCLLMARPRGIGEGHSSEGVSHLLEEMLYSHAR